MPIYIKHLTTLSNLVQPCPKIEKLDFVERKKMADDLKCGSCDFQTSDLMAFVGHKKAHDAKITSDNLKV